MLVENELDTLLERGVQVPDHRQMRRQAFEYLQSALESCQDPAHAAFRLPGVTDRFKGHGERLLDDIEELEVQEDVSSLRDHWPLRRGVHAFALGAHRL